MNNDNLLDTSNSLGGGMGGKLNTLLFGLEEPSDSLVSWPNSDQYTE